MEYEKCLQKDLPEYFSTFQNLRLGAINLIPICCRCNSSMSNTYSFKEWERLSTPATGLLTRLFNWTRNNTTRVR